MNLVSLAMKFITPDIVMKIASALGLDRAIAERAIGAAIPSIFSGLAGAASRPEGARGLAETLGRQDPGLLGNLAGMIGGSGQSNLVSMGTSMLSGVLGNSAIGSLAGALGKFTGMGDGATRSLLGMIAPVALGTLGQQARQTNLDAGGIANLLSSQRDSFTAAMPAGFSQMLNASGMLDQLTGGAKAAAGAAAGAVAGAAGAAASAAGSAGRAATDAAGRVAGAAAGAAGQAASHASQAAQRAAGGGSWLPWLLALGAILLGLWYFMGGRRPAMPPAGITKVGDVDVGSRLSGLAEEFKGVLSQVKDKASAEAALPKLTGLSTQLTSVQDLATKLPAEGKKAMGGVAANLLKVVGPLLDQALAASGAGPVLKPIVDQIRARIEAMAKL